MYDTREESRNDSEEDTYHGESFNRNSSGQDDSYTESQDDTSHARIDYVETINIYGSYQKREINKSGPVKLIIEGNDHLITVTSNTPVVSISLHGIRNVLNLSRNSHPKINNDGIQCEINYK